MGWVAVTVPLLAAAFTITRPAPLPSTAAALQPAFDSAAAREIARDLATVYPDRSPGSPAAAAAAASVRDQLAALGLQVDTDTFAGSIAGRGRVDLRNVTAVVPGRSRDTIVVVAHRDSTRGSSGVNDNASGTGALIELARSYAATRTGTGGGVNPNHTLVFASTDAGAYGQLGAQRLAQGSSDARRIVAVVVLDSLGSTGHPRLELTGPGPRSPSPTIVSTAAARVAEETGREPDTSGSFAQLLDLAFPFSLTEQGAFLRERIPAVAITTEGARGPMGASTNRLDGARLGQLGRAAEGLLASLDENLELAADTTTYVYASGRVIRGWTIVLLYVAILVPFALALADLLARLRRRQIAIRPAIRSYVRRLGFWLWLGVVFAVLAALGAWPSGSAATINPASAAADHWPRLGLAVFLGIALVSWLIARTRLARRGAVGDDDEIVGIAVALTAIAAVAIVLSATNPYALLLVLPSAHAWLWSIELRRRPGPVRAAVYIAGLAGPILLIGSFALRFNLGLDAPWYLAALAAIGYIPRVEIVLLLAWVAAAAQVLAVISGRYTPYPPPGERSRRGPVGEVVVALRGVGHRRAEGS